ncbi:MAG TPA: YraN family protein [Candidatus Binatia bacterium]|jgi:putative endonuclease|nr:YraN family protein [Candidatus Binatia bacterium]
MTLHADRDETGLRGEDIAARHLAAAGCRILERRWRSAYGEIDLVAEDRGEIVFVEVKTRRGAGYGLPEEAVTAKKREHLRACAAAYLQAKRLAHRPFRIDIVAISLVPEGARLAHFRSAVGEEG